MSNNEYNQDDVHRRDRSELADNGEHETHTTALILLVLATAVLVVVILFFARKAQQPSTPESATTTIQIEPTSGYAVPTERIETTEVTDLSGLPADLPVTEDAETVRNFSASMGEEGGTQRVYMYSTSNSVPELVSVYESWLEESNFSVTESEQNDTNATIRAQYRNEQLVLGISTTSDGNREVQVNHLNLNN